jgi:pyrroloquinoline quinone (PQQ) biosynthesis protein C
MIMIQEINTSLQPQTKKLLNHPLYSKINTPEHLRCFMEHHVFAVWDFMSLLKALQEKLTATTTPWVPVGNPELRYLINEIVLAEETDLNIFGKRQSHFEMYLDAMSKSGASRVEIEDFILQVTHGTDIYLVIAASNLPISIKKFLKFTFEIVEEGKPHKIAAAFTFGREGLIPDMFTSIIKNIQQQFPEEDLKLFKYYFDRHIELDADEHGPMAFKMVEELCENDPIKIDEVKEVAQEALNTRIILWDGILEEIETSVLV